MEKWTYPYLMIATHNQNKKKQIGDLIKQELGIEVKSLNDFPSLPEVVEDQDSFEGNARKKAEWICSKVDMPVLSDDSGLVVPALGGEPGIYSARYAGPGASDQQNMDKLLQNIQAIPLDQRQAQFVCAMALALPTRKTQIVYGECAGHIVDEPRGVNGFGYDPIFYLPGEGKTMAEIPSERKYEISHRAKAMKQMMAILKQHYVFL